MAKRPATKSEKKPMNDINTTAADPLADLGLDIPSDALDAAAPASEPATAETNEAPVATTYEIGKIKSARIKELPTTTRAGGTGGQFPFAELEAPNDEGYDSREIEFDGGDEGRFRRAVQSATTQANRTFKSEDPKADRYFVSRSNMQGGKLVSMTIIRTDERPVETETK